jgi:hypothetical protein
MRRIAWRRVSWELAVLTAITLPFFLRGLSNSTPAHLRCGDAGSQPYTDLDSYFLWREAQQIYGRNPSRLGAAQWAWVKRSCRCTQAMKKHAMQGLDSLTDDECRAVADVLPKRHPNLDEFPGFAGILDDCRQRLARIEETGVEPGNRPFSLEGAKYPRPASTGQHRRLKPSTLRRLRRRRRGSERSPVRRPFRRSPAMQSRVSSGGGAWAWSIVPGTCDSIGRWP